MPVDILIVEDEAQLAESLARLVGQRFDCGRLDTATDGEAAAELIAANAYTLVLSNWNLPKKMGDALLERMRGDGPNRETPFIMLTARSDRNTVMRALKLGVSDFLVKPFEKEALVQKLARHLGEGALKKVVEEQKRAADEPPDVLEVIDRISRLLRKGGVHFPVLPDVAAKVSAAMQQPEVEVADVVKLIQTDAAITSKLIGISNSAAHRGAGKVNKTLEEAVIRLGLKQTQNVVLMTSTKDLLKSDREDIKALLSKLWEHALATGVCAKMVGQKVNASQPDLLFTMGLMHDIGKLVLIQLVLEFYPRLEGGDLDKVLAALHAQVGAALLKEWNFPLEIVEGAQNHHDSEHGEKVSILLRIVGFANIYTRFLGMSLRPAEQGEALRVARDYGIKLTQEQIDALTQEVRDAVKQMREGG